MKRAIAMILAFAFVLALVPASALAVNAYDLTFDATNITVTTGGQTFTASPVNINEGASVTIAAKTDASRVFTGWSVTSGDCAAVNGKTAASLAFTMPSNNITIQANYRHYTKFTFAGCTVAKNGAAQSSPFYADGGDTLVVTRSVITDKIFNGWDFSATTPLACQPTDATKATTTYTVTVPPNTTSAVVEASITAKQETAYVLTVIGEGTTIDGGTKNTAGNYQISLAAGNTATIKATAPGNTKFKEWAPVEDVSGKVVLPTGNVGTITMPDNNVTVKASYLYPVTLINEAAGTVTIGSGTATPSTVTDYYEIGDTPNIIAEDPVNSFSFIKWVLVSGSGAIADPTTATTTYTVPSDTAGSTLKATYATPTVTYKKNLQPNTDWIIENHGEGDTVTIKPDAKGTENASTGNFVNWKVEPASFTAYTVAADGTISFTMPNYAVTLTPVYWYYLEITNGTFTINDGNTQFSGKQKVNTGSKVTLTPVESTTQVFYNWASTSTRISSQSTTKVLSFYMPAADVSAYPNYKVAKLTIYGVRGSILYADKNGNLGSGTVCVNCGGTGHTWCDVPGSFRTFHFPAATTGRTFTGYTSSSGLKYTVGTDSQDVMVEMPTGDAYLTANYSTNSNYYPYTGAYIKLVTEPQRYYSQLEYFYGTGIEVYYYQEGRDIGEKVDNADLRFTIVNAGTDTAVASGTPSGFALPSTGEFDLLITYIVDGYQMAPVLRCMSDASNHIVVLDKRAQFVSITQQPVNTTYYYGEGIDPDGMRVFLKYADHVSGALQYFSLGELSSSEYTATIWNNRADDAYAGKTACLPKVLDTTFENLKNLALTEPDKCIAYNAAGAAWDPSIPANFTQANIDHFKVALAVYYIDKSQVDTSGSATQLEYIDSAEPVWVTFAEGPVDIVVTYTPYTTGTDVDTHGNYPGTAELPTYEWWKMMLSVGERKRTVEVEVDGVTPDDWDGAGATAASKAEAQEAAKKFYFTNEDSSVAYLSPTDNPLIYKLTPKSRGVTTIKVWARGNAATVPVQALEITVTLPGEVYGPASMNLNLTDTIMYVGSKITLYPDSYSPSDADTTCTWQVAFADQATGNSAENAADYVRVDENGVVTVLKYTHRQIRVTATAKYDPKTGAVTPPISASCLITIFTIPADGITISETALTLYRLSNATLTAKLQPTDVSDTKINWTSSDSTIVSVDSDGKLVANKLGTATITATANSNDKVYAKCVVTVKEGVLVTAMQISKQSLAIAVGESSTLAVTCSPDTATNKTVSWTTSNTGIATVDANGKVRGVSEGSAVVTATANDGTGLYRQCIVNVSRLVVSAIVLNKQQLAIIEDNTEQLTATVYPTNASLQKVTWSSSNEKVATVDSDGVVTGTGGGACYVTATANDGTGKYVDCVVVVTAKIPVTGLTLNVSSFNMLRNDTTQLLCSVAPANATYTAITWTSSYPQYATVSDKGLVTSLADGETTITATAGGKSISIKVNVTSTEYSYGTVANCARRVNVRKSSSGTSASLGYAYLGDTYKILGKTGSWYKIQYNATTEAYIWSYYLKAIATSTGYISAGKPSSATPAPGTTATPAVTTKTVTIVNCTNCVNVRSSPDSTITTNKLGLAYKDEVFVYNSLSNGWYEVQYNTGTVGYISASFCQANG